MKDTPRMGGPADANRANKSMLLPLGADQRVLKLLGHPLRYKVFSKLGERPWSATQLAPELGQSWERIREQIRILHREGLAEPVGTEKGPKGGRLTLYRAERFYFTAEQWAQFPPEVRSAGSFTVIHLLFGEASRALEDGSLESRDDRALIRHPLCTDEQGAKEIEEIMVRAHAEVEEVERRGLERQKDGSCQPIRLVTGFLSFPTAKSGGANCPP